MKKALLAFIIVISLFYPQQAPAGFWPNRNVIVAAHTIPVKDSTRKIAAREKPRYNDHSIKRTFADDTNPRSRWLNVASLALGILGFWFFPAIAAIVLGIKALKRNRKLQWMAIAGISLGIAFLLVYAFVIVYLIYFF